MNYPNTRLFIDGQWCDAADGRTLAVLNPATGQWVNAVDGNFGGTPFFAGDGAYDSLADFHLGYYGVDTADDYVWAVLDHNSEFTIGEIQGVPEPSSALVVALACGCALQMRRRRHCA